MYIHGTYFKEVNEYRLATPWDIGTAVWYDHYFPSYSETAPTGMFISEANNYAFLSGQSLDSVVRYRTDRQAIQIAPETTVSNIILPGSTRIKNSPLYVDGYLQVRGSTTVNALTVNGTLAAGGSVQALTLSGSASSSAIAMYNGISTGNITFGTSLSTGVLTIGATAATGAMTFGQSTAAQTLNFGTGATTPAFLKVVNIATGGAVGSTSTVNIGPILGTGTVTINSGTTVQITSVINSVSTNSGALSIAGGVGIGSGLYVGGAVTATNFVGLATAGTNATNAASLVGYLGMPQNYQSTGYTVALSDQGKHIYCTGTNFAVTIPANSSVAFPIGATVAVIAGTATTVTIAITTDTMYLGGAGTTGSRTLAPYGMATAVKVTPTSWFINGTGLT
jgi:hypothetical protein